MQAYSKENDISLTIDTLDELGEKLDLPSGWELSILILEEECTYSESSMSIIGDDLGNNYMLTN